MSKIFHDQHDVRNRFAVWRTIALIVGLVLMGAPKAWADKDRGRIDEDIVNFLNTYCLDCHSKDAEEGELAVDRLLEAGLESHPSEWEAIVRKLRSRQMPPLGELRPADADYQRMTAKLVTSLDKLAEANPYVGETESFRRLTQAEYKHAIRDLLSLDVDVRELLPRDESSHGFDNVTVTGLSPLLLDRYVSAAQKISRLAVGDRAEPGAETTYRVRPDITQDVHQPGAPLGTRGGWARQHYFPQDGEYEIQAWLMRDRNDEIESLRGRHQLEFAVDRKRVGMFTIARPRDGRDKNAVDANLTAKVSLSAGPHQVSIAFLKHSASLLESVRQPLNVHYNFYRHPRIGPAVYQVSIRGPYQGRAAATVTPSRERIFSRYPTDTSDSQECLECAEQILRSLMRRAYRREVTAEDLRSPLRFYREGWEDRGFDAGIERALGAVLVSPHFLFRMERTPEEAAGSVYALSSYELASRLSFFLWSSLPDEELLDVAARGRQIQPEVLESQVRRMLKDKRSLSLAENFAAQWLYLRNLDSFIPDMRLYPDFDDNLRQALRQETEMVFADVVREDRSVLDLIRSDYTYLNERLAKHYRVPHVYGSQFRQVKLSPSSHRGGLLRHGSILTVTSYATRTSPVIRGNWVLENIFGSPPPPPPPNVPALEDNTVAANLSVRARLEQHRADAACASCHDLIDPVGYALENFDALGRWRDVEAGEPIDVHGQLADGREIDGVAGLEQALLERPELFVQTLTEKLMTFALGRGIESADAPTVRSIVRRAQRSDYRFSELILGIVESRPFQMRKAP